MNIMNDMNANSFRNLMGDQGSGTNHITSDIVLVKAGVGEPYEDLSEEEETGQAGVHLGVNGFEPASMVRKVNIAEKIDYFEKFERERSVIRKEGAGGGNLDFELESRASCLFLGCGYIARLSGRICIYIFTDLGACKAIKRHCQRMAIHSDLYTF